MKTPLKALLTTVLLATATVNAVAQKNTFEIRNGQFLYNNKETQIISGEMHYTRIPHQYWRHRMQMLKAMGLNTVATYVFWNAHETAPDNWRFEGDEDLARFIETAQSEGLHVILRPGPYACAEWDFGGYPWWLQKINGLELRRDNPEFLERTQKYLDRLYQEVGHLQITRGGPIILIQVENEFGSYAAQRKDIPMEEHRRYNAKIKEQLAKAGFNTPFFTSDGTWLFEGGSIEGILPTANGEGNIANLRKAVDRYNGGKGPYMVAEFYPGWLAHWAEPHPNVSAASIAGKTGEYLKNNISFNFYMAHGGTNFGFTSGANYDKNHDIQPDLTSYDYDAPISEAGRATPKFDSIRNVIRQYVKYPLPELPAPIPSIEIPAIKLTRTADVLSLLHRQSQTENATPLTFEQLNQPHGYVLYSHHFNQPIGGTLHVPGLRDYAVVYVDGEKAGELNRYDKNYTLEVDIPFNATLEILVENMGRINYGPEIVNNAKGIISPVTIDGMEIAGNWQMSGLPMSACPDMDKLPATPALAHRPALYEGTFHLTETGDTFIDMEPFGKGIVFVNGRNIGRYWQAGPQQTLYIPGVWLKKGENRIVIFEQLNGEVQTTVRTVKTPVLTTLK